jgi:hypothetical protein
VLAVEDRQKAGLRGVARELTVITASGVADDTNESPSAVILIPNNVLNGYAFDQARLRREAPPWIAQVVVLTTLSNMVGDVR